MIYVYEVLLHTLLFATSFIVAETHSKVCPFMGISTISSPMYAGHVSRLVQHFQSINCHLIVNELSRDIKFRRNGNGGNKFRGNGVKIATLLENISKLPMNSTFLWIDATVILPDGHFPSTQMLDLLRDHDMVVAGESGKKKVNIGVLLMRNGAAVQEFLRRILSKVSEGHWDQGVACCMLNKKTKYKCKGISRFKGVKYRFFPDSIVDVEGIFSTSECRHKVAKLKVVSPAIVKLVGLKSPRDACINYYDSMRHAGNQGIF